MKIIVRVITMKIRSQPSLYLVSYLRNRSRIQENKVFTSHYTSWGWPWCFKFLTWTRQTTCCAVITNREAGLGPLSWCASLVGDWHISEPRHSAQTVNMSQTSPYWRRERKHLGTSWTTFDNMIKFSCVSDEHRLIINNVSLLCRW